MKLHEVFTKNLRTKMLALFIAVVIWFYAYNASVATKERVVPLRISTDPGWVVTRVRDKAGQELARHGNEVSTTVTIQYPRRSEDLLDEAFRAGRIEADIAARGDEDVEIEIPLDAARVHIPSKVGGKVKAVRPAGIRVTLAQVETKTGVKVDPDFSKPPPGTRISEQTISPRTVSVTGPKSVVAKLKSIKTELIDLRDETAQYVLPISRTVKIDTLLPGGKRVQCDEEVDCAIRLAPEPTTRVFEDIPVLLLIKPDHPYKGKLTLPNPTMKANVKGPPDRLKDIQANQILLFVDVRGLDLPPGGRTYRPVHWSILGVRAGEDIYVEDPADPILIVVAKPGT